MFFWYPESDYQKNHKQEYAASADLRQFQTVEIVPVPIGVHYPHTFK